MKNKNTISIVFTVILCGCTSTKNNNNNNSQTSNAQLPFHYFYDCENNLSFLNKFNRLPTNQEKADKKEEAIKETKDKYGIDLINCTERSI